MTRAARWRLALVLAGLIAAGIAGLLVPTAAGALPAAVGVYVLSTVLRSFRPHDHLRTGWLLVGLSAVVAAVAKLAFGSAHALSIVSAPLLLFAGVWRIHGGLSQSPLAASLPLAWRIVAACAGLASAAACALDGGLAWPVRVATLVPTAATVFLAVRMLGLAVPLRAAGRPSAWLAGSALLLALDAVSAAVFAPLRGVPERPGWALLGLAAWSVGELRRASLARLTTAREDTIMQAQRSRRRAAAPVRAP